MNVSGIRTAPAFRNPAASVRGYGREHGWLQSIMFVENAKIKCAEAFFRQLTIDGYAVSFQTQLSNRKAKQVIDDAETGL